MPPALINKNKIQKEVSAALKPVDENIQKTTDNKKKTPDENMESKESHEKETGGENVGGFLEVTVKQETEDAEETGVDTDHDNTAEERQGELD